MSESALSPDPASIAQAINRVNTSYCQARILHSAVEIGLFAKLSEGPATLADICAALDLHPRLTGEFLDALVGLDLLERTDGAYRNGAGAEMFLVPGTPMYLGGSVQSHATIHYQVWGGLTDALRDGHAKSGVLAGNFLPSYQDIDHVRRFMAHMDGFNSFVCSELDDSLDWTRYSTFLDVGGARGNVAAHLVRVHPHLRGGVFELPQIEPLFDEHMAAYGTADRVTFHAGDFFVGPLPKTDVAIIGHVLHDWPPAERQRVLERVGEAVPAGGALLIYDAMIDDDRRDAEALLQSLRCRMMREGGSEYTPAECAVWVEKAGFRVDEVRSTGTVTNDRILVATRV